MSDTLSDAEKIRLKRLAKLGGGPSSSEGASSSQNASPTADRNSSGSPAPPNTGIATTNTSSPQAAATSKAAESRPKINITSKSAGPTQTGLSSQGNYTPATQKRDASHEPEVAKSKPRTEETPEIFEDKMLGNVFRITLDESKTHDFHGHSLRYLPGLKDELVEQGADSRLTTAYLDQALMEAASGLSGQTPLEYLLSCWKRIVRLQRDMIRGYSRPKPDETKIAAIKEAKRICMSYCIFAATIPDMFGVEAPPTNILVPHLLVDPEDEKGLDFDFLSEAVARFEEDESVKEVIVGAAEEMSRQLSRKTMNDDYKPYVLALRGLVRVKGLPEVIAESPIFCKDVQAGVLEVETLLGPFFQISPLQADVANSYFSSPKTRDQGYINNSQNALRLTLQTHQEDLLDIINHFIRASVPTREKVLDWFAMTVNLNHKRRAMRVDQKTVSSDGFMINVTTILDRLCEPFMDATFTKVDRISVDYLRQNPRVQMKDETKLNADQATSDKYYSQTLPGKSHFISEVFFLTVAAHQYGNEAAISKLSQLEKDIKHMDKQIQQFEQERQKYLNNPAHLTIFDNAVKKYKDQVDRALSFKYTLQGVMGDQTNQARSMLFMRYVSVWMLRIASSNPKFPAQALTLPLPEEQPEVFKCLPEYFLEVVVNNFKHIMYHMPDIVTSTQAEELVKLCITFLRSSSYIKNPGLKSGLVTILFRGTWPRRTGGKGVLDFLLNSMPFALENLLHTLMQFYIEAEFTGSHSQFFDKFNIRYEIFQIIKCIWPTPVYRENLSREAKVNVDFFIQFVNLLLNDVTFVLDESFTAFAQIHDLQVELAREGPSMSQETKTEKEEALASAQGKAKNYMQLTNETVAMLKLFTEALKVSFTMPEIVQRLADMLDYNLDAMVGPKSSNLKVDNFAEYRFDPKGLLSEIVDVYLNLMDQENFILAVARDGRSYKPASFQKASFVLKKWALKNHEELAKWEHFQTKVADAKAADDQAEEDMGEIPDDFLDPLMATLMEDPVILPSSRVTIDRSTIRSHLLSDPNDPFNRAPLKIEDVKPDTEMKAKIEAFKAERKSSRKEFVAENDTDAMDTST